MSGGLTIFDLPRQGEGATRRGRGNAALIRHRQRFQTDHVGQPLGSTMEQWQAWREWVSDWERVIIRYRDGNTTKGQDDGR